MKSTTSRAPFAHLGRGGTWLVGVIVVALVGAVVTQLAADVFGPKPALTATLDNVDRDVGVTLDEYSASTEIERVRSDEHSGHVGRAFAVVPVVVATSIAATAGVTQTVENGDADSDGIPDVQDRCAGTPAGTEVDDSGCPLKASDRDRDGVTDAQDRCAGTPAGTEVDDSGCPLKASDRDSDGDGVADARDRCPGTQPAAQVRSDGCTTARALIMNSSGCSEGELDKALDAAVRDEQEQRPTCTSVVELAQGLPGGDSEDPEKRSQVIVSVLRSTRTRPAASGRPGKPVGVAVRFDLTLKGFDGRKVEIRWSLYSNGRPVPRPWLKDHPVLTVTVERDEEKVSPEFWVPMPKTRAQYYVRIEVFDEHNTKLTHQKTEPFR